MGGAQSADTGIFQYECNIHVAEFINNDQQYLNELKGFVDKFAKCISITTDSGVGKVNLQANPGISLPSLVKDDCQIKLDEYFQSFVSFEESFKSSSVVSYALSSIANSNLRCSAKCDYANNKMRITGVNHDVKKMIRLIRERQDSQQLALTSASSSPSYPVTCSVFSNRSQLQPTPLPPFLTTATTTGQVMFPTPKRRTIKPMRQTAAEPPDAPQYVSAYHIYKMPAPDFTVARFIKYSRNHTQNLQDAMKDLANVTVFLVKLDKKVEYIFRPVDGVSLSEEEFEKSCQSSVNDFLKIYASKKRRFNHEQLMKAVLKDPKLFEQQPSHTNETLYIRWHLDDDLVIICGLKNDVATKEHEIVDFLNSVAPRKLRNAYTFKIDSPDNAVAKFVKDVTKHKNLLKQAVANDAQIWITPGKFTIHCKATIELSPDEIPMFEERCKACITNFFKRYTCWRHEYPLTSLQNACASEPQLFGLTDEEESDDVRVKIYNDVKILIVGMKQDVNRKKVVITNAIQPHLPSRQPKITHKFCFPAQRADIGNFIWTNKKHRKLIEDCTDESIRIWLTTPEAQKVLIHIQGNVETPEEKSSFESKCRKCIRDFFKNYSCWKQNYRRVELQQAIDSRPDIFNEQNNDVKVEIRNQVEVVVVGLKEHVTRLSTDIPNALQPFMKPRNDAPQTSTGQPKMRGQTNTGVEKEVTNAQESKSSGDARRPSGGELKPFLYQLKSPQFLDIVVHIFQSNNDLCALEKTVGFTVQFKPFPNIHEPRGVRFYPRPGALIDHQYYGGRMPQVIKEYFQRYGVTIKQCKPYEVKPIMDTIHAIGIKFRLGPCMLSILQKQNFIKVVGPKEIINEISMQLHSPVHIISDAPPNQEKVQINKNPRSRKSSSDSTQTKQTPTKKAQAAQSKTPATRKTEYTPKKAYAPLLTFVLEHKSFFENLKTKCEDICIFETSTVPLQLVPRNIEKVDDHGAFTKEVVKSIEGFLDLITTVTVPLDSDVISLFKQQEVEWLSTNWNQSDCAVLQWQSNGLDIKGLPEDIKKYQKIIQDSLQVVTKEKPCSRDVCRVLINCDVLNQANIQLQGRVKVSCSLDEEIVYFTGKSCFIKSAIEELAKLGELIEQFPTLSDEKFNTLQALLSGEFRANVEVTINEILSQKGVKAVLVVQSGGPILTSMTLDVFNAGCKLLDNIIHAVDVGLPEGVSSDIFDKEEWKNLHKTITDSKLIIAIVGKTNVKLMGINKNDEIKKAADQVKDFFKRSSINSCIIKCKDYVKRFLLKHYSNTKNNEKFPTSLCIEPNVEGIKISGPCQDVNKGVEILRSVKWQRAKLLYSSPKLLSHFSSESWKDFQTLLENAIQCTIAVELLLHGEKDDKTDEEQERYPSSTFSTQTSNYGKTGNKTETKYGNITVTVSEGDITADDSDVIINGATRDFNLSRGTVSSALLRRAGNQMQDECNNKPVMSSPVIRVTHGWNLLCDYVIHLVTPHSLEGFTSRMKCALDHAELLGVSSIALPTLGAGGIGLDSHEVSCCMAEAFESFAAEKPLKVKTIKVIVYESSILAKFHKNIICGKEMMNFGKREALLAETKTKSSLSVDDVTILVNAEQQDPLQEAKLKIKSHMSKYILRKVVSDELLSEMDDHDCIDIYAEASKHYVSVTFNLMSNEIILNGLSENVGKLYDFLREILYELREANTVSQMFVWKWACSSNQFTALPLRVSRAIQREYQLTMASHDGNCKFNKIGVFRAVPLPTAYIHYQKNTNGTTYVSLYGSAMIIDFSKMAYEFNKITGKLSQCDSRAEGVPLNWSDMNGKPWIKVALSPDSKEYNTVVDKFRASKPAITRIVNVERVQHPTLYKQYLIMKNGVERHMLSKEPVERELFHGTSQTDADRICAEGFDRGFCGKNATVYGKGSYFALESTYSVRYAPKNHLNVQYIFLARVLTGDYCQGRPDYKAPPQKIHSGDIVRLYDSVVDNATNPSIFVVFKDSSVYPYYLISFIN